MSNQGTAQEPTMEEILASIRRIISEDSGPEESAAPAAAPEPEEVPEPEPEPVQEEPATLSAEDEADILELTEPLPEEPLMAEPAPEPEPAYVPEPAEEMIEDDIEFAPEPDPVPEPAPAPEPVVAAAPQPEPPAPAPAAPVQAEPVIEEPAMSAQSQPIVSGDAEKAASAAFGALASSLASGGEGRTLEEIVSDMLRPMLKEWLDGNLPPLVERLVAEEIERIARRRG
ncbi:DUF2497 domain-containing protein [Parvibaculum sp.]|uniref:DUF2497 domain-containing protein n=1 Tax=Parvibaculum sp. TaxID=2024848 RepID=UPI001DC83029|nr:DUF2497 domain-containing protein [Parvibaculum sp.]MBX3488002.1 DUF2497 domain-containing protein [Parvibaculum sp.]MCW5728019.1 DUF2497 domain-containing protein [Parvibaculum sp.]